MKLIQQQEEEAKNEVLKLPNTMGGEYDSSDDDYDDETLD
jgi:hypothetical protein